MSASAASEITFAVNGGIVRAGGRTSCIFLPIGEQDFEQTPLPLSSLLVALRPKVHRSPDHRHGFVGDPVRRQVGDGHPTDLGRV